MRSFGYLPGTVNPCYQCLPYLLDYKLGKVNSAAVNQGVVMVVSPLVSLMVD